MSQDISGGHLQQTVSQLLDLNKEQKREFVKSFGLEKTRDLIKGNLFPRFYDKTATLIEKNLLYDLTKFLAGLPVPAINLLSSKIGKVVNKIVKSKEDFEDRVVQVVTPLVIKWKGLVKDYKAATEEETRSFNNNNSESKMSSLIEIN